MKNNSHETISLFQTTVLLYATVVSSAVLMKPAVTAQIAGREMWLSPIFALILGLIAIYMAIKLNEAFPGENIIQYSTQIIGKIPGKILGLFYIYVLIHINGANINEYANFVTGNFLLRTPFIIIVTSMVFVCSLAVRAGIEVLGRTGEIFFPFFIIIFFLLFLLLLPEFDVDNILPMFENGLGPSIKAVFSTQSWYSELFLLSFLLPVITSKQKNNKWKYMIFVLLIMALTLTISNLITLFTFDLFSKELTYPLMSAVRYISIFDFLENVDAVVMASWVGGAYVKISVYYYAIVVGMAHWLNVSSYRAFVFPTGIILSIFGFWISDGFTRLEYSLGEKFPLYLPFIFFICIPTLLYGVYFIKSKFMQNAESKTTGM